jgi:hypothetical protein
MSGTAKMCILMTLHDSAQSLLIPQKLADKWENIQKIQYRDSTHKILKYLWADKVESRRLELLTLGGGSRAVAHPSAALCIAFSKSSRNSSKSLTLRCSQVPQDDVPACLPSVGVTASLKRGRMDESSKPPSCWLISRARLFMAPWTNNLSI